MPFYHAVRIKGQTTPRSQTTRIYIIVIGVCVVLIIALIIALAVVASKNKREDDSGDVCMTEHCVAAAARLSESLDRRVKPCDDFFQFACGAWNKKHVIEDDKSLTGVLLVLEDDVKVILKNILEKKDQSDTEALRKAKDYYKSCVDEERIEKLNLSVAVPFLETLGGWPVLGNQPGGNWNSQQFSLVDLLSKVRQLSNSPPIIDMFVYEDFKNHSHHVLFLDQPKLGMPDRDYYLKPRDDKTLLAYQTYATKTAIAFGADPVTAQKDVADVVDFEIKLANISMPKQERRDEEKLYNPTTIQSLTEKHGEFQWLEYFQKVFALSELHADIDVKEKIIVRNPDYIGKVSKLLSETPSRVVANYVVGRALLWLTEALPLSIRELYQHYRFELTGTASVPARWKFCTRHVNDNVGLAVGKLFVDENFDTESKHRALEMIEDLRESMKDLITNVDWMDEITKRVAKEKAEFIEPRIGYPEEILDAKKINKKYKRLQIHPEKLFENGVSNLRFSSIENLEKLRKKVDRSKWENPPATVNAYYNPVRNTIIFPAGILQPPLYSSHYPQYLNYGGIGFVIGHEITHGFDDSGRLYDKTGNLNQWWDQFSIEHFKRKANCTIKQYNAYKDEEANKYINGILTLGENIADNGGIKEGFKAYRTMIAKRGKEEPKLPGLEFTPNQLFFLSAAHAWCGTVRPKEAVRRIIVDTHSPFKYRVIGSMQNSEDFAKTFNCPVGSYMNPKRKCQVW